MDVSEKALEKFGVQFLQRVNTLKGEATVYGVAKENGLDLLWFHCGSDGPFVSYWPGITSRIDLENYDFEITSEFADTLGVLKIFTFKKVAIKQQEIQLQVAFGARDKNSL